MKPFKNQNIPVKIQLGYLYVGIVLTVLYLLTYGISLNNFIISLIITFVHTHSVSIVYHRYLVHHAFKLKKWFNYIGSTIACLHNSGSPFAWRGVHFLHHKYADTKKDPHAPENSKNIFRHMIYVASNDSVHYKYCNKAKTKDLKWMKGTTDGYHVFLHNYGHYLKILYSLFLLFVFGFEVLVVVHLLPIVLACLITAAVNLLSHMKVPFSWKDHNGNGYNNFFIAVLFSAGEGWHNNHHTYGGRANFGEKWWQIDTSYYIIKLIGEK